MKRTARLWGGVQRAHPVVGLIRRLLRRLLGGLFSGLFCGLFGGLLSRLGLLGSLLPSLQLLLVRRGSDVGPTLAASAGGGCLWRRHDSAVGNDYVVHWPVLRPDLTEAEQVVSSIETNFLPKRSPLF